MANARPDVVVLKNVRLGFPKLWKPEAATEDGKPKFGGNFILNPEDPTGADNIKRMKAAMTHAAKAKWEDKWERVVGALEKNRKCLRDGNTNANSEGDVYDGFEGMMYVAASNPRRPQILDRDKTPITEDDGVIYAGCYVDAVVSVYATNKKEQGGNGIFATLEIVRFRKDGEPFGAAPLDADDYLDDMEDEDGDVI